MAGETASSAPQSAPSAAAGADNPPAPTATGPAVQDATPTVAPAATDAPGPSSTSKRGKGKGKATTAAHDASPLRATRSSSAVTQDAEQLRLEQFASRQRELDARVDKFESRVGKVETAMANFKVDVSKAVAAKDDPRIRDVTNRAALLERTVKDLSSARDQASSTASSLETRIAALEERAQRTDELESRVRALEELVQANEAAASAALAEVSELRAAADSDWNSFVEFRDDAHGRLRRAESALQTLQEQASRPRAAPPPAQARAPSPLRHAGRHERDVDSDEETAPPKKPRRESGIERQPAHPIVRPATPAEHAPAASVDQADSLTIWNDGEDGEDGWITCRIGQPERVPHEAAFLWSDDNEDNMILASKLCDMVSRKTGACPKPVKIFATDNDVGPTWRACQFASRENLKRFMRFWVQRPDQYRSLRAIPCADQNDVASIADLMREVNNRRARPDTRRDKNNARDDRRDGRRDDRRDDRREVRRDARRDGRRS